jgi:hypothetical protein
MIIIFLIKFFNLFQFPKPVTNPNPNTTSMSLSSLHEFVRANTNNYNRALNNAINQVSPIQGLCN